MNKVIISLAIVISLQLQCNQAQAWGIVGHHTSAQIAYEILSAQKSPALNEIKKILKNEDFVQSSTWADEVRGSTTENWKQTVWYHFEKMNETDEYLPHLKTQTVDVRSRGGVIQAIMAAENVLKDRSATDEDQSRALKFLVHFIGDVHQPLHTGRIDDNGGNKIPVKWLDFDLNLHQVWDSQIIALGHADIFKTGGTVDEQVQKYADYLNAKFKTTGITDQNKLQYADWLQESLVPRADAYKYKDEEPKKYTARFIETVDMRVYLAGVRIAYTMNRLFPGYNGAAMPLPEGQQLVDHLQADVASIVGDFNKVITLKPIPMN